MSGHTTATISSRSMLRIQGIAVDSTSGALGNAASHLWSAFLLERAPLMTRETFESLSAGYCAVSGSPVTPHDYNRYLLRLDHADGSGKARRAQRWHSHRSRRRAVTGPARPSSRSPRATAP